MGIGAARIWLAPESADRRKGLNIFITQLIVNFFWSLIFFNAQAFGFAFLWLLLLWVLIILLIIALVGTNTGWIVYENQFEDVVTTTEIEADQEGDYNFVSGGDLRYVSTGQD